MMETALIIGMASVIIPVMLYNAREISRLKTKVDLIYDNIKIAMRFNNNSNK